MSDSELERSLGDLLRTRGLTLALAESCTGGLIAHRITDVAGSSDYFLGGIVSYSNQAKEEMLGVQHETLRVHGAVSEPAAREMARGARRVFGANVALSVTGIAGPAGGTADKPVGLAYVALSAPDVEWCERYTWAGNRETNKAQSAEAALRLLQRYLAGNPADMAGFEPSVVEAQFDAADYPLPRSFTWRGRRLAVADTGRRWEEAVPGGTSRHILVMTAEQSVFELRLTPHDGRWAARQVSSRPALV